jgi:hypothetical protein
MLPSTIEHLHHILDEITYLRQQSANVTRAAFLHDETLK